MALLTVLTLVYAAVLVVALAASLLAIWLYLRRIARGLRLLHETLNQVADGTDGLDAPLGTLQQIAADAAAEMDKARADLGRADDVLVSHVQARGGARAGRGDATR